MHLTQVCDLFISHCQSVLNLSPHTLRAYEGDLAGFQRYFNQNPAISSINKDTLRQYFRQARELQKYKDSSLRRKAACLKLLFRWAINESLLAHSPFEGLNEKFRLPKRLPRCLDSATVTELRRAIAVTQSDNSFSSLMQTVCVSILLTTGIRVGELVKINLDDISLSDQCIRIQGKGNRQRLVFILTQTTYKLMQQYVARRALIKEHCSKLIITETGRSITTQAVRKYLKELIAKHEMKVHVTPHMLRHTCATQWLSDGLDIRHVQKLLGHHSISTTEIYTHLSDQSLKEALLRVAERQKVDN